MTHDHPDCQEQLAAFALYRDGEADADLCAAIESHVQTCPNCHAVLATLEETIRLCRGQPRAIPSAEVRTRLLEALGLAGSAQG